MSDTDPRTSKTYQDETTSKWVTEDHGRPREATSEEIDKTIASYEQADSDNKSSGSQKS